MNVSFQRVPILIDGHDKVGHLVFLDGDLVAVLARLDGAYHNDDHKGAWHLEAGLGRYADTGTNVFQTLAAAERWVRDRVQQAA